MVKTDSRIPVRFGAWGLAGVGEAVLVAAVVPLPAGVGIAVWGDGHAAMCACCGGRVGVAAVLSALFVAAARGDCPAFSAVVADVDAERAAVLRAALHSDRFLAARYVEI